MNLNTRLFFKVNSLVGRKAGLDFFGKFGAEYAVIILYAFFVVDVLVKSWPDGLNVGGQLLFTAGAWSTGWLLNLLIGKIVREPRPHVTYPQSKLLFTPLQSWKSFPSDHSMSAWLPVFLSLFLGLPFTWPLVLLALWVSWGRVYAGVHYPLDIVGGAGVAAFVTGIFYVLAF